MKEVMKEGEHYGIIPGCGDKPALLKPGAEKLNLTFRMSPTYKVERIEMSGGHREYVVTCVLSSIGSNVVLGEGVGSCSTMEAKYRYRTGPKESTGKPVPKGYWDARKSDPSKAQALLGGKGFSTMKDDTGNWVISVQGEKVEHDNPADYYNTILKMAKKRAHVDAVLTVTAASDIFTQDIEDFVDLNVKTNGAVVDVVPVEVTRISKMIEVLTKSGKLGNAEKFVGRPSSQWTEADIDKIESAKASKAKTESPQAPPTVEHLSGQGLGQVEEENVTTTAVEPHTAELARLITELDVPLEMILEDNQVSALSELSAEKTQEIIDKLKG
jgi:hypothetical protein